MKLPLRIIFLFGIFSANINLEVAAQHYFRSAASGNWTATATWQMSSDNIVWASATSTPTYTDYTIEIRSGDSITISSGITIDQVTIDYGGVLSGAVSTSSIAINNGSGVDLMVNGTFYDNISGGFSILFASSATWQMGANATFIKTTNSSSNSWQQNYQSGIQNIPSTANWIIRKNSSSNPAVTTVGAYYPNLTIENFTSSTYVTPTVASSFNGSSNYPTILGNLDIGGSGTGYVSFYNGQTNSQPTKVKGNFTVRSGSTFRNYGTGLEVQGNVQVDGTISYDSDDRRLLDFTGSSEQTISGSGTINIYNMRMMKTTGNVTLDVPITIDDSLYLNNGYIIATLTDKVIIGDNGITANASASSFIKGAIRKTGDKAYTFPVGADGFYKPITISSGATSDSYVANYYRSNPKLAFTSNVADPLDHISACEYWELTKESGSVSRTVTLNWDANSCGVVNPNELRIVNYDESSVIWNSVGTSSISGSTTAGSIISTAISQFGYFTLGSTTATNPLPVSLIDFTAASLSDGIYINWSTASEVNNDHFEILSSSNGETFQTIGKENGHGNSTELNNYSFVDRRFLTGQIFYRLKQIDFNGKETLSNIIRINIPKTFSASVFPNPYNTKTKIQINSEADGKLQVSIYDSFGREVNHRSLNVSKGLFAFDPETDQSLGSGIYFVRLCINESSYLVRLLKD